MSAREPFDRLAAIFGRSSSAAPAPVERGFVFGFDAGFEAYRGGVVFHLFCAVLFGAFGFGLPAAYHVASAGLYAAGGVIHARGGIFPAFLLCVLEVVAQAFLSAHWFGLEAGFHAYFWPPVVIAVLVPGVARREKALVAATCVLGHLACVLGFDDVQPRYDLEPGFLRFLGILNWLCALALAGSWALRFSVALSDAEAEARREHERASLLLANVLPGSIVERLKSGATEVADGFGEVTVLFADLVGFTKLAASRSPHDLVALLDRLFSRIDALAEKHGVEKIKTIGDAYMAAAGVPDPDGAPAARMAAFALELRDSFASFDGGGAELRLRIGLATGPAVAGVIGRRKFSYDLWGDTVNTASRMESHGEPGRIHVDERTQAALGAGWRFEDRGTVEVKGKGPMRTFFLEGPA